MINIPLSVFDAQKVRAEVSTFTCQQIRKNRSWNAKQNQDKLSFYFEGAKDTAIVYGTENTLVRRVQHHKFTVLESAVRTPNTHYFLLADV